MSNQKVKEPLLAVLLSCVFLGLGHIYAGSKKLGVTIMGFCVGLSLLVLGWMVHPTTDLLFLAKFSGGGEIALVLVQGLGFIIGLLILIDSYRSAKRYNSENNLERKFSSGKRVILILGIILCYFGLNLNVPLALGIRTFVVQAFKVSSGTMSPTLIAGDRVLANKMAYDNKEPERGDIVVFKYPVDPSRDFLKRLIAMGGETVEIKDGDIFINGTVVSDSPIKEIHYYSQGEYGKGPVKVPDGNYFVLGDNSATSSDSRYWGFVPKEDLLGKVYKTYYPFNRSGPIENANDDSGKIKDGIHKEKYTSGMWDETTYKTGIKNGPYRAYWANGNLQMEVTYKNDVLDGVGRMYHEDGKLYEERTYKSGVWNGYCRRYDEDGNVMQDDKYKDGLLLDDNGNPLNGIHKDRFGTGEWQENEYVNGLQDGLSKDFNKDGRLVFERKFVEGKIESFRTVAGDLLEGPTEWTSADDVPPNHLYERK